MQWFFTPKVDRTVSLTKTSQQLGWSMNHASSVLIWWTGYIWIPVTSTPKIPSIAMNSIRSFFLTQYSCTIHFTNHEKSASILVIAAVVECVPNLPDIAKRKTKCGSNDKDISEKWSFTCICRKVSYAQDFHICISFAMENITYTAHNVHKGIFFIFPSFFKWVLLALVQLIPLLNL